ncbi:hypothetical protein BGZ47_008245 [Haplosporangium gracile]|nr:hypothetical protein BGZ47_008245 [Haplosporangium gracile]
MKERQTPPPRAQDPKSPTRRLTRSTSHPSQLLVAIELPLVAPTPTTSASTTSTFTSASAVILGFTRRKHSAEDQEDEAKRVRNGNFLFKNSSPSAAIVPPAWFGPLSKTPFPAFPSTSFRPILPPTPSLALPPTSFRPNSEAPVPATPAAPTSAALTHSVQPIGGSASAISIVATCIVSASRTRGGMGMRGAKGNSSRIATRGEERGSSGGGGREVGFDFDKMDVMEYVNFDLMGEATRLFEFTSRPAAKRGSSGSGSDYGIGGSPTAQDFLNEDLLAATVMRFAGRHELLTVDREVIAYLTLAAKERLRALIERMAHASRYRRRSSSLETLGLLPMYDADYPMFRLGVGQDVRKQLLAIERVEREEEVKYKEHISVTHEKRLAVAGAANQNLSDGGAGAGGGKTKKRVRFRDNAEVKEPKTKEPKMVLTEEEKLRLANQTALGFAGNRGKKGAYAWMAGSGGVLKRPQAPDSTVLDPSLSPSSSSSTLHDYSLEATREGVGQNARGLCNPPGKIIVKDALFCLEHDCGGGEGTGWKVLIKNYVK